MWNILWSDEDCAWTGSTQSRVRRVSDASRAGKRAWDSIQSSALLRVAGGAVRLHLDATQQLAFQHEPSACLHVQMCLCALRIFPTQLSTAYNIVATWILVGMVFHGLGQSIQPTCRLDHSRNTALHFRCCHVKLELWGGSIFWGCITTAYPPPRFQGAHVSHIDHIDHIVDPSPLNDTNAHVLGLVDCQVSTVLLTCYGATHNKVKSYSR